jgi:hypothetical protein
MLLPKVKVQERYEKVEKDVDNYWGHRFSFVFLCLLKIKMHRTVREFFHTMLGLWMYVSFT